MLVSILHRVTGGALTVVGLAVLALWMVAIAGGEASYDKFVKVANHPVSLVILAGLTWAFWQHLFSGLRHLVLDTGAGYDLKTNRFWAVMTLAGSLFATGLTWYLLMGVGA
jgi:succinate dehydrogenase / fumarate reductase cytochrome b subunit